MTYQEALNYLDSFINYEKRSDYSYNASIKLDRMQRLSALLGDPHRNIKSVHIAGSKGKGSTAAFTYSILKKANFRTGLYTSPHLESFRERIRIDDVLISEEDIGRLMDRVKDAVDRMKDDEPTFFEVYTALAFLYFEEKKVDFAVYEVGLGGRLDATNIIEPLVSAVTPISYEHTDKLGDTLTKIASEKCGIVKENGICVSAPQEKEALEAIKKICNERKSRLIVVGEDIKFKELKKSQEKEVFNVSGKFGEYALLETRLLGYHQVVNATVAVGIVEALRYRGIQIPPDCIRRGIEDARWDGRLEVIGKRPLIVVDGAQNKASARALAGAVRKLFRYEKLILVLGVSKDKDIKGILEELVPLSGSIVLTKSNVVQRALEPSVIREMIPGRGKDIFLTQNVKEALETASGIAKEGDLILITGSLFVVGEARCVKLKEKTLSLQSLRR